MGPNFLIVIEYAPISKLSQFEQVGFCVVRNIGTSEHFVQLCYAELFSKPQNRQMQISGTLNYSL